MSFQDLFSHGPRNNAVVNSGRRLSSWDLEWTLSPRWMTVLVVKILLSGGWLAFRCFHLVARGVEDVMWDFE